jgi:hypothetical protein
VRTLRRPTFTPSVTTDLRPLTSGQGPPGRAPGADSADVELLTLWRPATSRLLVSALALTSVLVLALGFASGSTTLRLIGIFGALIFGAGAAPLQLADGPLLGERVGVAVMLGLSISSLVGAIIALTPLWYPFVAAALVALPSVAAHTIGVARSMRELRQARLRILTQLGFAGHSLSARASLALSVCGAALSLAAAVGLGHIEPGVGGFLPVISPVWYGGVLMLLAAVFLGRDASESHVALPVLLLGGVLTLTPAIVYGEPSTTSAVKHVLLVEQVLQTHRLHPTQYIYYAYSGFFDGMAWLFRLAGVNTPMGLAVYWPAVIGLLGALELRFMLGRVVRSGHRCWLGVLLAVLADSVGQNYFSPQSEGFVIALGVFALVIVGRRRLAMSQGSQFALLIVSGLALAVTHELSPYLAGGAVLVLSVFGLVKPRWASLAILLPAAGWALLHLHALAGLISFGDIGDLSNFEPPPSVAVSNLVRSPIVGYSSDALALGLLALVALAVTGLIRNRRRPGAWAFFIAAGVGILFVAVEPYGDEGIFRAALFGIPWLTMIGLAAVRKPPWRWAGFGALSCVLLACFLVSSFGLDDSNVVHANDVAVLHAYVRDAPPGSYHLEIAGEGDLPVTLDPLQHNLQWDVLWNPENPHQAAVFSTAPPSPADLNTLTSAYIGWGRTVSKTPARNLFAVYSPTAARYSVEYALETMANSRAWLRLFLRSPRWKVLASSDGAYLFRYSPPGQTASTASVSVQRKAALKRRTATAGRRHG